jgi:hypothetical protein
LEAVINEAESKKKLGGIDFNDIKVKAAPLTKSLEFAPFDVNTFAGFTFKVSSLKKVTEKDLLAMVA